MNAAFIMPDGRCVDSGVTCAEYAARVQAYENAGDDRSDAQGRVDCEILNYLNEVTA